MCSNNLQQFEILSVHPWKQRYDVKRISICGESGEKGLIINNVTCVPRRLTLCLLRHHQFEIFIVTRVNKDSPTLFPHPRSFLPPPPPPSFSRPGQARHWMILLRVLHLSGPRKSASQVVTHPQALRGVKEDSRQDDRTFEAVEWLTVLVGKGEVWN